MVCAEGTGTGGDTRVYQCDGPVADALRLAIYLSGRRPSRSKLTGKPQWSDRYSYGLCRPHVTGGCGWTSQTSAMQAVWCPTTDLGTWTAEQDGQVFLTGNSNAKAGHPSKGLLQTIDSTFSSYMLPGHGDVWNPIDNAIAAIRYMFARYGHIVGPSASGYAAGGMIPGFAAGGPVRHHVKHAPKAKHLSLGKLTETLTGIPGFGKLSHGLVGPEEHINALGFEQTLLGEMGSEATSTINPLQSMMTHLRNFVPFGSGTGVFDAERGVLGAQLAWQKILLHVEEALVRRAAAFTRIRAARLARLRHLAATTYNRLHKLKAHLEAVKLHASFATFAKTEARNLGRAHLLELRSNIRAEEALPVGEKNEQFIANLRAQEASLAAQNARMEHASKAPVIEAELKAQIHPIEEHLHTLSGSSTRVGTAGEIGAVAKQITALDKAGLELRAKEEETRLLTIPRLELNIERIGQELGKPVEATATGAPGESELASLLKQQNEQLTQQLAVSQAQYKVLANFPPFAGHFDAGGIVPGPWGAARTAIVHGGEVISPAGAMPQVSVHVADGMGWLKQFIRVEFKENSRGVARPVGTPLPSRGGGQR
jgi:hypothetical protein